MSMAWDETESLGLATSERRSGLMSDYDRKDTLYQAYRGNVWISSAINVIAKRITSGGYVIEKVKQDDADNDVERTAIETLLLTVNDDEDFLQLCRATIVDLCIFGEAYWEVLYKGGKPYQLHKVDCISMGYELDMHGTIISYQQTMGRSMDTVSFQPQEIIRWWFPDPRSGKKALSPIESILGPVDADGKMSDWTRQFFKKGARPAFWVELAEDSDPDDAQRFIKWFKENYTGMMNAHVPPVMYNGGQLHEFSASSVDMDFIEGRKMNREEVLAGFLVPPASVGIIESGNIGGGTGESQDKSLQYNACDPIKQMFFEKFNDRITKKGFGITRYKVSTRYADYRGDDMISMVQDRRIRNGSLTIDEVREEIGRTPVLGGNINVIATGKEVTPVERLGELADEQRQMAQIGIVTAQATADKAQEPTPQAPLQTVNPTSAPPEENEEEDTNDK
jgi:HK97 family phage portal protein